MVVSSRKINVRTCRCLMFVLSFDEPIILKTSEFLIGAMFPFSLRNIHLQVNFRQNKDKGGQNLKVIYVPTEKCPKTEVDSSTRPALAFFSLSLKHS